MNDQYRNAIKDLLRKHSEENNTPEKAREYLYSGLGTHNRDGSLCKQYGGEYTDQDHPVHSK